jgi:Rieske Fe-S protein
MRSLCGKIIEQGGKIFTQTHADEISGKVIKASGGFKINAGNIVVATNTPISTRFATHTKQYPYRTYVIACKIPKGTLPKALWWDTGDHSSAWFTLPYHYVRLQDYNTNYDLLIAGGEDHKTGQADKEEIPEDERYKNLYDWTKEHFPDAGEVLYHWSGQVIEPMDSLAFIGKDPTAENVYLVTGDSGNGITHGTLAGIILKDLILGRKNKFSALYDPSRKNLSSASIYIKEQLNVAAQYADLFSKGDVENLKDLLSGNGAVIRYQLNNAVYRDETGKYNFFSAICPHLKCVVQWKKDEKTFDCPCHGSRFSCYGKVINGPANKDLEVFESEKIKEYRT